MGRLYTPFFLRINGFVVGTKESKVLKSRAKFGTCLISGLTVRDEIEMSSNYMQQQSANVHSINSTVSKESAFDRQFFLLNVSETAVTPKCTEF